MNKYIAVIISATYMSLTAQTAMAGQSAPVKIVELFTSQGCSSCPVSNALLTDLSDDEGVLGLTYGVEYWDYLGWKDTFASPTFSTRQRAYSQAIGHGRVYTPQMIVNGSFDKPRINKSDIALLSLAKTAPKITMSRSGSIALQAVSALEAESATVRLITYTPGTQNVSVKRGENGGRTLKMTNVVLNMQTLGTYTGQNITLEAGTLTEGLAYAVILQDGDNGPILSAANYAP